MTPVLSSKRAQTAESERIILQSTQAEVAVRMKVSQPYVAKIENGKGKICWSAIARYAEACGKRVAITLL